jgi:hypothetical protein
MTPGIPIFVTDASVTPESSVTGLTRHVTEVTAVTEGEQ